MKWWWLLGLVACHPAPTYTTTVFDASADTPVSVIDAGEDVSDGGIEADTPKQILLVGDSQVLYAKWYMARAGVQKPNETLFYDSHPGTTILTWNRIFVREMSKFPKMDEVLIFLGTNNNNFTYLQPLDNILGEVKRENVKCVWVGGTEVYHHHHPIINNLIRNAVSPTCQFFDTEAAGIDLIDGVHPSPEGAKKWLKLIWDFK